MESRIFKVVCKYQYTDSNKENTQLRISVERGSGAVVKKALLPGYLHTNMYSDVSSLAMWIGNQIPQTLDISKARLVIVCVFMWQENICRISK